MAYDWIVTAIKIAEYLLKARQAYAKVDEATKTMKGAAEALVGIWEGAAAQAFASEQGVLNNWCMELLEVGSQCMDIVEKVRQVYEQAEETAMNAITSKG
ncbi:MAG: hypothetical protein IKB82_04080 [Clostridia bacterium]|nr:hypothetical protein [Clostridia bacterium]